LKSQCQQVELDLDVLVEGLGHTIRHHHIRYLGRGLRRDRQPALDLADVVRILLETYPICVRHLRHELAEATGD
jgi:hypothetical protein